MKNFNEHHSYDWNFEGDTFTVINADLKKLRMAMLNGADINIPGYRIDNIDAEWNKASYYLKELQNPLQKDVKDMTMLELSLCKNKLNKFLLNYYNTKYRFTYSCYERTLGIIERELMLRYMNTFGYSMYYPLDYMYMYLKNFIN